MSAAGNCLTNYKIAFCCTLFVTALMVAGPITQSRAEPFEGPSFRKGMWHFVRTIDLILHKKTTQRLVQRELTQCVDPTHSMIATFASGPVGNCVSAKPEKANNKYTFANRCDFMGPVSTVITVHSEEAYTELNEATAGLPKAELVVARRIGDCEDAPQPQAAVAVPLALAGATRPRILPAPPVKSFAAVRPPSPH